MQNRILPLACLACLGLVTFAYLLLHTSTLHATYEQFVGSWKSSSESPDSTASAIPAASATAEDKIVVIGRLQSENTDWVAQVLPEWQNAIYTVDNTSHHLHTDVNKGREANPYLTYIIQNYDKLPSTIAFLHAHRNGYPGGWHTDAAGHDNVNSLRNLNLDYVQRVGYANLRCTWLPGCPAELQPFRDPPKVDDDGFMTERAFGEVWPLLFGAEVEVPRLVGIPCCAQFAVSRDQVLKRSLSEYKRYHQWLMETDLDDHKSGWVFEYLWHIIFGQDPVHCPFHDQCFDDVYNGRWK